MASQLFVYFREALTREVRAFFLGGRNLEVIKTGIDILNRKAKNGTGGVHVKVKDGIAEITKEKRLEGVAILVDNNWEALKGLEHRNVLLCGASS